LRYRVLGGTGIEVSVHCLGTMMFGAIGNPDHDDCVRIVHAALDAGIKIVGKALQGRRDDVVLATKVHFPAGEGPNRGGNSRRWIVHEVEQSLRRLRTDWLDLYQVHRPDYTTDVEETLSALTDLVRAGKIRAFGCSTFPPADIVEAYHVAERRGLQRFRTEQPPYSLLARGIETSVLPTCARLGMGVLTWSPLAAGFLSGRFRRGKEIDMTSGRAALQPQRFDPSLPVNQRKLDAVEQLVEIADDLGCTLPDLAIAFAAAHPAVTSVITGPRTMDHLTATLKGASVTLDDDALDRIDKIVPPGVDLYRADSAWSPPWLTDARLRRRTPEDRPAA
jgi:aryl-alcohol dehydrogenase-like predicted oxidoreductase